MGWITAGMGTNPEIDQKHSDSLAWVEFVEVPRQRVDVSAFGGGILEITVMVEDGDPLRGKADIRPFRLMEQTVKRASVDSDLWVCPFYWGYIPDTQGNVLIDGESFPCKIENICQDRNWQGLYTTGKVFFGRQSFPVRQEGDHWILNER